MIEGERFEGGDWVRDVKDYKGWASRVEWGVNEIGLN
jgi:hypothetical protein